MPMTTRQPIDLDGLDIEAIRAGVLQGRPVTVLGFARSGIALARFFADAGATVTVYDGRVASELGAAISALGDRTVSLALGPDVDPGTTWADADLVATSPSINADYPTTEPRLRAALRDLLDARAHGDAHVPSVVSEPDLFLRLCVAPTIGVTGTKGKTTTASLTAAILATDPGHPAVLGGNIGIPIVERLPDLTPDHRVVDELSELQLPTLSRGTTVAVYTNVTSDHLDRHGSLERYRLAKQRLAELVDPDGALVLNAEDPVVSGYGRLGTARAVTYQRGTPPAGGLGVVDDWIVARDVERLALAGGGPAMTGPDGRIMPIAELAIPGAHNVANALAAVSVGLLFGIEPAAIRAAASAFPGVEHRLETVAVIDGVRFVNDSQGTQPDAVIAALRAFAPPIVLIAGGRDKGVDLEALGPVVAERAVAAVLIGESGPDLAARFRASGLGTTVAATTLDEAVVVADGLAREALARSARGRRSRDRAAEPGRGQLRHVHRLCGARRCLQDRRCRAGGRPCPGEGPMNLAPPIRRLWRPDIVPGRKTGGTDRPTTRTAARTRTGSVVQRERHQADYVILVVVVALTALGILMVYSSSAIRGYLSSDSDTFATVGPQIQWAVLGIVAMAAMMRVDYRYLRLVSVPFFIVAIGLLVIVLLPPMGPLHPISVGGSARWLQLGPLPAIHPAEVAKLALVIYLAHWFAKRGTRVHSFWGGTAIFLIIITPIIALVFKEPDLGTTMVITLTAFIMFFVAGANIVHFGVLMSGAFVAMIVAGLRGYQLDRIRAWLDPWSAPLGDGFHTIQGLLALGVGGLFGSGLGQSQVSVPNAFNDFVFAEVGQEFGLLGGCVVILLFFALAYSGIRISLRAPDTFGALLAAGITGWLCIQAFINIGVVVALFPITGITLPFISAGGSSLIISFAAVGILLSISRETIEKGTWNDDAIGDRRRGDGRAHLPGSGRGHVTPRPAARP